MALRFLGTTSDDGDCPTLYEIDGTDEILVQGDRETTPSTSCSYGTSSRPRRSSVSPAAS